MRYLLVCFTLLLSVLSCHTFAASRYFMGATLSSGSGTATNNSKAVLADVDAEDSSSTYSGMGYSLKMGMKLRRAQRLELAITQLNLNAETKSTVVDENNVSQELVSKAELPVTGIDFNYLSHWRGGYLQPYYALGAGFYLNNNKEKIASRDDIYGGALNVACGLLVPMGRHAEMNFALQGKAIYWQQYQMYDKETDGFMATMVQTTSVLGSVLLGFNFIF
jgi:hypothetical protein